MENNSFFINVINDSWVLLVLGSALLLYGFAFMAVIFRKYFTSEVFESECDTNKEFEWDRKEASILLIQCARVLSIVASLFLVGYIIYSGLKGSQMQGHMMEWLNLIVRWSHVIAGIMWIGASFYFVFLENNLNRTDGIRDELAGNLWAIHGGGFYFLEKYKVAPQSIPKALHWFKYEAYFTWITGFSLLWVVYYFNAQGYMIDKEIADISEGTAVAIGIGTMLFGWIVYDMMCKSKLIENQGRFAVVGVAVLTGIVYFLTHTLNARAAFIHVGALIGTIMAWNVYFVIIPGQKGMVKAATTGQLLDASLGKKALQRSLHNNYFTLPVLFIMISNHFPSTFGHQYNWLVLMLIIISSAAIKHYWNLLERGEKSGYILPVAILMMIGIFFYTAPGEGSEESGSEEIEKVEFWQVQQVVVNRCVQCHSRKPTDDQWTSAPNGQFFDKPDEIANMKDKIMARVVVAKNMPQGNKTNMTDQERELIKHWIIQGGKVE